MTQGKLQGGSAPEAAPASTPESQLADATQGRTSSPVSASQLSRLEQELDSATGRGLPPVERWNPPYCGDIGLEITRDGVWHYRKSPIQRPALVKLFASVLRRDADGRHYLVTPVEKVDVTVEDAPFLGVDLEVLGEGREQTLVIRTNLDDVVRVGTEHPLRFETAIGGGMKPYVLVRGRLEALLTRAITFDLAELMLNANDHRAGVWSGGRFFAMDDETAPS